MGSLPFKSPIDSPCNIGGNTGDLTKLPHYLYIYIYTCVWGGSAQSLVVVYGSVSVEVDESHGVFSCSDQKSTSILE